MTCTSELRPKLGVARLIFLLNYPVARRERRATRSAPGFPLACGAEFRVAGNQKGQVSRLRAAVFSRRRPEILSGGGRRAGVSGDIDGYRKEP